MFLSGSSAGGYTALQAACVERSPLTAVTATSAIIDPVPLALCGIDAHMNGIHGHECH